MREAFLQGLRAESLPLAGFLRHPRRCESRGRVLLEWGRVSVEAIAVHEGIAGYRDRTLSYLRAHCEALGVPLRVVSFAQRGGQFSALLTHAARANGSVCSSCGVLRRSLLNEASHGCDYLATGHNLDDEAQSVVMNLVKANRPLLDRKSVV